MDSWRLRGRRPSLSARFHNGERIYSAAAFLLSLEREGGGEGREERFGYDGKRAGETLIISSGKFVDRGEGGPIPPRVLIEYVGK